MKPQKALHLHLDMEKKKPASLNNDYYVFEKYDGWYGYIDFTDKPVEIRSSAGRVIPSLQNFCKTIKNPLNIHYRLVFEILLRDVKDFPTLNGILNRHEQASNVYLKVHDLITLSNIDTPFNIRYGHAKHIVSLLDNKDVELADPFVISNNYDVWMDVAKKVWARDGEGVILKNIYAPYSAGKRNADLMKIKEELTLDLYVEGLVEGEGKYKGTTGALLVRGKNGLIHTVSGMTDEQRTTWWNNPNLIKHYVVEIKAMKQLPCGSLREPRFKAVRYDKGVEDID